MLKRWFVKRRWLVVLEATKYTRIHGQQQLGKCLCVAGSQPTKILVVKFYSRKIFSYVFFVRNFFYNKNKANYGNSVVYIVSSFFFFCTLGRRKVRSLGTRLRCHQACI